jgi:Putative lumazine-binding
MTEIEKIKQAILNFIKGGDDSDSNLLDTVLHKDFRVTNNGFMGTPGVTVINKTEYLNKIETGIFGGLPRQVSIEYIDVNGTIAMVKIKLESEENSFVSYNSLVLDNDAEWRLINNLAVVESKLLEKSADAN